MQTFLPYPLFTRSAACLDCQRLGKQRVEVIQLLQALTGLTHKHPDHPGELVAAPPSRWRHHAAARMWAGYEPALAVYGLTTCRTWIGRGYNDTCFATIELYYDWAVAHRNGRVAMPPWRGDPDFHLAHQSNLIRKLPEHYRPIFGDVPDDLPYVWPVPLTVDTQVL